MAYNGSFLVSIASPYEKDNVMQSYSVFLLNRASKRLNFDMLLSAMIVVKADISAVPPFEGPLSSGIISKMNVYIQS